MATIDGLPPLRAVITSHDLVAKRQLGQNFLLDLNLTAKIARLAGDIAGSDVLEVGPGPGGLTRGLLVEGARHVVAVEKDARCIAALHEIAAAYPGRLTVIEGDAMVLDLTAHLTPPIRIAANLPYNIGTEPDPLADPQGLAAVLDLDDPDVPARGCLADHGQTGR